MTESSKNQNDFLVTFVGLKENEQAPQFGVYLLDIAGRPTRKLSTSDGNILKVDFENAKSVALGPDVEDFRDLPKESLTRYRVAEISELWRKQGIVLPNDIWSRFYFRYVCVTGTVRKCRPWFWDIIEDVRLTPKFSFTQTARIKPITAELQPHVLFPLRCQPLCEGIVEVYERECCCFHVHIPSLLDRLREILEVLPIPIPDPIPDPFPGPFPGPDPAPFTPRALRTKMRLLQQRKTRTDFSAIPPENLYEDYLALRSMSADAARLYVLERPYLTPIHCQCSIRKVGQTLIQSGGHFDFCYRRGPQRRQCVLTYAYKVKQLINGSWTVIYDGVAAQQYFSAGEPANIRSYNPQAKVCADGPGDPPPHGGVPFVMLEHIGSYGTFHFNFPAQTGVSQVGALAADDGTYTTTYAPDCPWGSALGLRLWFSPELEPIIKYYRLAVLPVTDSGSPVGAPVVLDSSVTWDKFVDVPGDVVRVPETLGPTVVGTESNLFKVPYWSSPDHRYLSGQFHQVWNTAQPQFPDGKYMLIIEVFDGSGNRVKPNGAAGPGTEQPFQFRRWASATDTDPVPFADAAHVFWVDNTPVGGDIVDLRKNTIPNTAECQFMSGSASDTFAIGFRAFHINGVEDTGTTGDDNSFMWFYAIGWQRGLNGSTGSLGFAPSGGTNHTDVGENGIAVPSGSETFANLLGANTKCTFSVSLHVHAKHFTGSGRIQSYDYQETASFALEITS